MRSKRVAQAEKPTRASPELTRAAGRIGDVVNVITAIAEQTQSIGAQCHHRGGARRRFRPRFRGGCAGGQGAGSTDRESDRRDRRADRRRAGSNAGVRSASSRKSAPPFTHFGNRRGDHRRGGPASPATTRRIAPTCRRGRQRGARSPPTSPRSTTARRDHLGFRAGSHLGADPLAGRQPAVGGNGKIPLRRRRCVKVGSLD